MRHTSYLVSSTAIRFSIIINFKNYKLYLAEGRGDRHGHIHHGAQRRNDNSTHQQAAQANGRSRLAELQQRAAALGANAVVGVDLDYEILGASANMLMVSASGTAVLVE